MYDNVGDLYKVPLNRRSSVKYLNKVSGCENSLSSLYDITACKCKDFDHCNCSNEYKVPLMERSFLLDQRNERTLFIGGNDFNESQKRKRNIHKQYRLKVRLQEWRDHRECEPIDEEIEQADNEQPSISDEPCCSSTSKVLPGATYKSRALNLSTVAKVSDHYSVSDTAAAAICSALYQDIVANPAEDEVIIDRNKIRRERNKARNQQTSTFEITSVYFDRKRDKTNIQKGRSKRFGTEEHISVVSHPDCQYVGHCTPTSGNAVNMTNGLLNLLSSINAFDSEILEVGKFIKLVLMIHNTSVIDLKFVFQLVAMVRM